jgi:RecA-family ATPase
MSRDDDPDAFARKLEQEQYEKFHPRKDAPKAKPNGNGAHPPIEPFLLIDAAGWHGTDRPTREFLDGRKLFPYGYASILTGAGAVGKTLLALQASVACTSAGKWLGADIRHGPVLFYSAEEPIKEMHIRIDEICEAENLHLSDLSGLYIIDLNELGDAALIRGDNKTGVAKTTELFDRLEKTIAAIEPVVVWLDNRGLLVTGNENDRTIASMAMRSLQLLAERYQCSIIMLSHPSLTGINTGTGSSGSTAWMNTARSVINMTKPKDEGEEGAGDDVRVLENNKANYAKHGTKVSLKWEFNRFICTDPPPSADSNIGRMDKAEKVFMRLMVWHEAKGIDLAHSVKSPDYAPRMFDQMPKEQREGLNLMWFKRAMMSLLDQDKIKLVDAKKGQRKTKRLVVAEL